MTNTISYAGIEWEVLDETEDGYFCISKDVLFEKQFDDNGSDNWGASSLRKYLNGEWLNSLPEKTAFLEFETDLTSDDGLKDYGVTTDKVSLLTCDQYRKCRSKVSKKESWWWTSTPWSNGGRVVRYVSTDGHVNHASAHFSYSVAPAVLLSKSAIANGRQDKLHARLKELESEIDAIKKELEAQQ